MVVVGIRGMHCYIRKPYKYTAMHAAPAGTLRAWNDLFFRSNLHHAAAAAGDAGDGDFRGAGDAAPPSARCEGWGRRAGSSGGCGIGCWCVFLGRNASLVARWDREGSCGVVSIRVEVS